MYEELLPLWKQWRLSSAGRLGRMAFYPCPNTTAERALRELRSEHNLALVRGIAEHVGKTATIEFTPEGLLVAGVMLFTWEQELGP